MSGSALAQLTHAIERDYRARTSGSAALFDRAQRVMPGGVSGNLRFYRPYPLYIARANGPVMTDIDGNDYLDCFLCNGPMLLGHRHPAIAEAIAATQALGSLTLNPALLVDAAEAVAATVPSAEHIRFVNSGTEALMMAARYVRGFTGKRRIVKFLGHYHGQDDQFLIGAGPERVPFGNGVPAEAYQHTLTLPFNDLAALEQLLADDDDIAAVILDPAMHSGGLWGTTGEYLQGVRDLTRRHGVVLVFDEVITGFRVAPGGAQARYGVTPDLVTLAKALGAGERIAAVAGSRDVMSVVNPLDGDPARRVFQSGTGNDGLAGLAAVKAAVQTYAQLGQDGAYDRLEAQASLLATALRTAFADVGIPAHVNHNASMLQLFLSAEPAEFVEYSRLDQRVVDLFYLALMTRGVILSLPTSNHIYLSFALSEADFATIAAAARDVLAAYPFAEAFAETN